MRRIDEIIIHCTASPEGQPMTVKQIDDKAFLSVSSVNGVYGKGFDTIKK